MGRVGGPSSHHSYPPFSPLTSQQYLPEVTDAALSDDVVRVDLSQPMDQVLAKLRSCPVRTRLSLTGPLVVARDIAHAKLKERLDKGEGLPQYMRDMAVYYAGPAKTPEGYASGSFGPTTAGRMDSYVDAFQAAGGSMVMLAKGNRSGAVTRACQKHGGFYLGSIGGPAAILAQNNITKVEVLEYAELGMEAIWCGEDSHAPLDPPPHTDLLPARASSPQENRSERLPRVCGGGRQGQRLLQGVERCWALIDFARPVRRRIACRVT